MKESLLTPEEFVRAHMLGAPGETTMRGEDPLGCYRIIASATKSAL